MNIHIIIESFLTSTMIEFEKWPVTAEGERRHLDIEKDMNDCLLTFAISLLLHL